MQEEKRREKETVVAGQKKTPSIEVDTDQSAEEIPISNVLVTILYNTPITIRNTECVYRYLYCLFNLSVKIFVYNF